MSNIVCDANLKDWWSRLIEAWNTAAHEITGEDMASFLRHRAVSLR